MTHHGFLCNHVNQTNTCHEFFNNARCGWVGNRKIKALAWAVRWIVVCTAIHNFFQSTMPWETRRDPGGKPPGFSSKECNTWASSQLWKPTLSPSSIQTVSSTVKNPTVILASTHVLATWNAPATDMWPCVFLLQQPPCSTSGPWGATPKRALRRHFSYPASKTTSDLFWHHKQQKIKNRPKMFPIFGRRKCAQW